ncbi:hypothetical protein HW132_05740 [Brasilonema sp. CT11]|nr:hypothetical protein [Brasilonema sp. CT11]
MNNKPTDAQKPNGNNKPADAPKPGDSTQTFGIGETQGGQWYQPNTVYQILKVSNPSQEKEKEKKAEEKNIVTTIVVKERGNGSAENRQNSFDQYALDDATITKLNDFPKVGNGKNISSYLPSSGVIFSEAFFKVLSKYTIQKAESTTNLQIDISQVEISNFYQPMRTLLYSRKISQLISKTWWSYLEAKRNKEIWENFINGKWDEIIDSTINNQSGISGFDILDGLIAREIFLFGGADTPDYPDEDGTNFYKHLKDYSTEVEQARFLILPSSRGWQGICLSLLLAGQAYYEIKGKYHQISQPIFSTGEITMLHSLEVDWGKFHGDIKELIIHHDKPWVGYHIVIPYPPIPFDAVQNPENLKKWAWAKEEYSDKDPVNERHFPFYIKYRKEGETTDKYLIDVDYFKPPYPYIPLSCS